MWQADDGNSSNNGQAADVGAPVVDGSDDSACQSFDVTWGLLTSKQKLTYGRMTFTVMLQCPMMLSHFMTLKDKPMAILSLVFLLLWVEA